MIRTFWLGVLVTIYFSGVQSEIRVNIDSANGTTWKFKNQNASISGSATVPGGIYTDLQAAGVLDKNLFYRFNDLDYRWVAKDNWTYYADFALSEEVLNKTVINLVFHGLDTVAEIYLNDVLVSSVDNMFIRHVVPVAGVAKAQNHIEVRFQSPIGAANARHEKHVAELYPVPPDCVADEYQGECHVNFLRKMQASFSWDWGPAFPSVGIWKSVEVEAFNHYVLRDLVVTTDTTESGWILNATLYIESPQEEVGGLLILVFSFLNGETHRVENQASITLFKKDAMSGLNVFIIKESIEFTEAEIEEWWPNGYGEQKMYSLEAMYVSTTDDEETVKTIGVAFRTLELVQEELQPGMDGRSFYFKINNVPIFAKGSDWIPAHVLPELGYDEPTIRYLLQAAKDTHQNTLRVWGGGIYESDLFYSIADELGLLIWQDMMFASSLYPTTAEFLSSVSVEIEQQVRRLQHHPCIVIWSGNNENEYVVSAAAFPGIAENQTLYKQDYIKLYVDTVVPIIDQNDPTRPHVFSSPSNGIAALVEGPISNNPSSQLYGDIHHFEYTRDPWEPSSFPDTRFASEFGYQSFPSFRTIQKISAPEDWSLSSEFSIKRQHHPGGNGEMQRLMQFHLPLPQQNDSLQYYRTFLYYSQIYQAEGIRTEAEKYRRDRSKLTENNLGHTMGAMYWQLNDVWEAATWSSIEFGGRWKMLHYFARHFFAPAIVSPMVTPDGTLNVYLVSDLLQDVENVLFNITIYSWDNFTPRRNIYFQTTLRNASSELKYSSQVSPLLEEVNCTRSSCFIHCTLQVNNTQHANTQFLTSLADTTNLKPASIRISNVTQLDESTISVTLTTDMIAPFVWLETDINGEFTDNGFILLSPTKAVLFTNKGQPINISEFQQNLTVQSLLTQQTKYNPSG